MGCQPVADARGFGQIVCSRPIHRELWRLRARSQTFYLLHVFLLRSLYVSPQIPSTPSGDLFHDRLMNLLWGRLTCELLMDLDEGAATLKELEESLANIEVRSFPPVHF